MTPERIAELREACAPVSGDPVRMMRTSVLRELLDEVERGRGEIADLLARLDAAAFGANQVHARLEAAEKLAEEAEKVRAWLMRLSKAADQRANENAGRFESLADANRADAKNYAATAAHIAKRLSAYRESTK